MLGRTLENVSFRNNNDIIINITYSCIEQTKNITLAPGVSMDMTNNSLQVISVEWVASGNLNLAICRERAELCCTHDVFH